MEAELHLAYSDSDSDLLGDSPTSAASQLSASQRSSQRNRPVLRSIVQTVSWDTPSPSIISPMPPPRASTSRAGTRRHRPHLSSSSLSSFPLFSRPQNTPRFPAVSSSVLAPQKPRHPGVDHRSLATRTQKTESSLQPLRQQATAFPTVFKPDGSRNASPYSTSWSSVGRAPTPIPAITFPNASILFQLRSAPAPNPTVSSPHASSLNAPSTYAFHASYSARSTLPATIMSRPSLASTTLRQQILSGIYVDLALLILPSLFDASQARETHTQGFPAVMLQGTPSKSKDMTPTEFALAFSSYRDIICSVYPSRRAELDDYLSIILDLALRFGGTGFYQYHFVFASQAAARLQQFNQPTFWGTLDAELYCRIFAARTSVSCELCGAPSHPTALCAVIQTRIRVKPTTRSRSSMQCVTIDHAISLICLAGRGAWLTKADIVSASKSRQFILTSGVFSAFAGKATIILQCASPLDAAAAPKSSTPCLKGYAGSWLTTSNFLTSFISWTTSSP
ncbi:hypothetical protein WMY93_033783 [Mugilogobius chulae]|uniref:Uncharacterized protein n=1 Tax=Mugilogobius chulae TaxID=88201 RepID=A0AAW0MMR9_9GOBI